MQDRPIPSHIRKTPNILPKPGDNQPDLSVNISVDGGNSSLFPVFDRMERGKLVLTDYWVY